MAASTYRQNSGSRFRHTHALFPLSPSITRHPAFAVIRPPSVPRPFHVNGRSWGYVYDRWLFHFPCAFVYFLTGPILRYAFHDFSSCTVNKSGLSLSADSGTDSLLFPDFLVRPTSNIRAITRLETQERSRRRNICTSGKRRNAILPHVRRFSRVAYSMETASGNSVIKRNFSSGCR